MGFSNTLKSNVVNEWKDYYVNYSKLRMRIGNKDFRSMLYNEVNKINSFYFLLEKKAVDEKNTLFDDIMLELPGECGYDLKAQTETTDIEKANTKMALREAENTENTDVGLYDNKETPNSSENDSSSFLKNKGLASFIPLNKGYTRRKREKHITEFLHSLVKIKAYRDLNTTGLLKLAKRYAETNNTEGFYKKFNQKLKETYFYKSKRIDSIRNAIKKMYQQIFAKGQPEKAKRIFKRLENGSKTFDVLYLITGIFTGMAVSIAFKEYDPISPDYKLLMALNCILVGFFTFGLCLKAFKNFSINYKFIFNFDVVSSLNNSIYMLLISSFLFCNNALFLYKDKLDGYLTVLQLMFPTAFLLNPFDIFFMNSRLYVISAFTRGILLPISTIRFRHFYFIDVLQSFRYSFDILIDCLVEDQSSRNILSLFVLGAFPFLRILQCLKRFSVSRLYFPHIANATKYLIVLLSIAFEVLERVCDPETKPLFKSIKYALKLVGTICSFFWDILIDWVIFRNRYMFPKGFYTFALIYNFFIRFYWLFLLSPSHPSWLPSAPILLSLAEILRRSIWTLIRVEVEHLNNCDELKLKKAINLTAGELFYKKNINEAYKTTMESLVNETEFETEMEEEAPSLTYKSISIKQEPAETGEDSTLEYEEECLSRGTKV
ncbi:Xenotropic and polytropic retrovirus receptor 1 [Glugoides intestinalis]